MEIALDDRQTGIRVSDPRFQAQSSRACKNIGRQEMLVKDTKVDAPAMLESKILIWMSTFVSAPLLVDRRSSVLIVQAR